MIRVSASVRGWLHGCLNACWHVCLPVCLIGGASLASAQTPPLQEPPHNIVQLSASASVEAQQDWLTLTLSTSREGSDAGAVQAYLRQSLDTTLAELKKTAQPGAMEVRSGNFSLRPRYSNEGKLNGWVGSTELVLEGSDFARIGTAASRALPLTVSGLGFGLSRQARSQLESQAQALAISNFKARASEIAQGFGFAGYGLREVSISGGEQPVGPVPRMLAMSTKAMQADAPLPLESGKSLVLISVSGAVQLK